MVMLRDQHLTSPLLGATVLALSWPMVSTLEATLVSSLDMDTALPGDLCRDPGVMAPLRSLRDITMVGTRSVRLRCAVAPAPGDRIPSVSPSNGVITHSTVQYSTVQYTRGHVSVQYHALD